MIGPLGGSCAAFLPRSWMTPAVTVAGMTPDGVPGLRRERQMAASTGRGPPGLLGAVLGEMGGGDFPFFAPGRSRRKAQPARWATAAYRRTTSADVRMIDGAASEHGAGAVGRDGSPC